MTDLELRPATAKMNEAEQRQRLAELAESFNNEFDFKLFREITALARALQQQREMQCCPQDPEPMQDERLMGTQEKFYTWSTVLSESVLQESERPAPIAAPVVVAAEEPPQIHSAALQMLAAEQRAPPRRGVKSASSKPMPTGMLACFGIRAAKDSVKK